MCKVEETDTNEDEGTDVTEDWQSLISSAPEKVQSSQSGPGTDNAVIPSTNSKTSKLTPKKFFALRWASVVTENSDDLLWSYAATPVLALSE